LTKLFKKVVLKKKLSMAQFTILQRKYLVLVEGLPQIKSSEILELVNGHSGEMTKFEEDGDDTFKCNVTLPQEHFISFQTKIADTFWC
jgi:hypothetical protein